MQCLAYFFCTLFKCYSISDLYVILEQSSVYSGTSPYTEMRGLNTSTKCFSINLMSLNFNAKA